MSQVEKLMVKLSIPQKSGYYFEEIQQQSLSETLFLGEPYIRADGVRQEVSMACNEQLLKVPSPEYL